tara:strand:- start:1046 stop:2275 length:1230 start_codon:yes stop_codon:yes gene_type:complete
MLGLSSSLDKGSVTFKNLYSVLFDGTDEYINVGPSNALVVGTNITISAWFKNSDGEKTYIFQGLRGATSSSISMGINFKAGVVEDAGYVGVVIYTGSTHAVVSDDNTVNDGEWHHLVATITNGAQKLYLDGSEVASGSNAYSNDTTTDNASIGAHASGVDRFMGGNLDEVAIWNAALDADAITAIYNNGNPLDLTIDQGNYDNSSSLKGYWRMGDGGIDSYPLIADQRNATIGTELNMVLSAVSAVGREGNSTTGWTAVNSADISSDSAIVGRGSYSLKFDADSNANAATYIDLNGGPYSLSVGSTYKMTIQARHAGTGDSAMITFSNGTALDTNNDNVKEITSTDTSFATYTHYWTHDANHQYFGIKEYGSNNNAVAYLDDLSIRQVNGAPGVMNGFDTAADIEVDSP